MNSAHNQDAVVALSLHDGDNVAVMAGEGKKGLICETELADGGTVSFPLVTDVPFGHKVSIIAFQKGDVVLKYGQPIGYATEDIPQGAHVHSHNLIGYKQELTGAQA